MEGFLSSGAGIVAMLTNTLAERASAKPTCDATVGVIQRLTLLYTRALDAHEQSRKSVIEDLTALKGLKQKRKNGMRRVRKLRGAIQIRCNDVLTLQSSAALGGLTGESAWDYHFRHWTLSWDLMSHGWSYGAKMLALEKLQGEIREAQDKLKISAEALHEKYKNVKSCEFCSNGAQRDLEAIIKKCEQRWGSDVSAYRCTPDLEEDLAKMNEWITPMLDDLSNAI